MIETKGLNKTFKQGIFKSSTVHAVNNVSLHINSGETLAILGPSGCGKSTLGRLLLGLLKPDSGSILFNGTNITKLKNKEMSAYRLYIQFVSQEPDLMFDPRYKLYKSISEPLRLHNICSKKEEKSRVKKILHQVGLHKEILNRYPHEVSGGQIQRAVIARVLTMSPKFIVLDEPTSMLDVSVQAQILQLLIDLQKKLKLAFLFITHDLDLASAIGSRIMVMNKGVIVDSGLTKDVLENPSNPFTRSLVGAFKLMS